jgi:hypothetical protein
MKDLCIEYWRTITNGRHSQVISHYSLASEQTDKFRRDLLELPIETHWEGSEPHPALPENTPHSQVSQIISPVW